MSKNYISKVGLFINHKHSLFIVYGENLGYSTLTFRANVYNGSNGMQSTNRTIGSAVIACVRLMTIGDVIFRIAVYILVRFYSNAVKLCTSICSLVCGYTAHTKITIIDTCCGMYFY